MDTLVMTDVEITLDHGTHQIHVHKGVGGKVSLQSTDACTVKFGNNDFFGTDHVDLKPNEAQTLTVKQQGKTTYAIGTIGTKGGSNEILAP